MAGDLVRVSRRFLAGSDISFYMVPLPHCCEDLAPPIRFRQEPGTLNKAIPHSVRHGSGARVHDMDGGTQPDCLSGDCQTTVCDAPEADVGKEHVDIGVAPKVSECLRYIGGGERLV